MTKLIVFTVMLILGLSLGGLWGQHRQDARALAAARTQQGIDRDLLVELGAQLQDARAALAKKPTETIVTVTAPCVEDVGHAVPVFSRTSQVYAGR